MTSMDRTDVRAAGPRTAVPFAVLAVLLGLLAMHGLASTHHAAPAGGSHGVVSAGTSHAIVPADAPTHEAVQLPAVQLPAIQLGPIQLRAVSHSHGAAVALATLQDVTTHAAAVLIDAPGATCDDDCRPLAVLCVAVLTGAALALLLARTRRTPLLRVVARLRSPVRAPPVRLARGPDPVEELCVSRT